MPIHNEAKLGEIAKTVVMPGDPMRAKHIAEKYLEDYKLVNQVRGMYAYTGKYKGKEITVMASGMGMPSMGIYCYELYKFYEVENIIRIGSCGADVENLNLLDIILVENSYNEGSFSKILTDEENHILKASEELNKIIEETSKQLNIKGNDASTECFDHYIENAKGLIERFPKEYNIIVSEMECYALFCTAKYLGKKAACLLTVADSQYKEDQLSSEERELALDGMIKLALESTIKI